MRPGACPAKLAPDLIRRWQPASRPGTRRHKHLERDDDSKISHSALSYGKPGGGWLYDRNQGLKNQICYFQP